MILGALSMEWTVKFHEDFQAEFDALGEDVQDELFAEAKFVRLYGPETSRPHVDTLKGSNFANMKELRFEAADGEWRAAFAFDPKREAIVLVAADKSGVSEKKFYKRLIDKADARYAQHLEMLKDEEKATAAKQTAAKPATKKGKKR
jgi:hypothetical protein